MIECTPARNCLFRICLDPDEVEHVSRQDQGQLHDIRGSTALEYLDGLGHLESVADSHPEGDIHGGDQGPCADPLILTEAHHGAGELHGAGGV